MACNCNINEKLSWVKGNTLSLAVPLKLVTVDDGTEVKTDYTPPEGSEIKVRLVGQYRSFDYDYTLTDNVVSFTDEGQLPVGCYGVEITVKEPTDWNRRTFKCGEIKIVNCTDELGYLPEGQVILDAAIFIQGPKGDKGDQGEKGDKGDQGDKGDPGGIIWPEMYVDTDLWLHIVEPEQQLSQRLVFEDGWLHIID